MVTHFVTHIILTLINTVYEDMVTLNNVNLWGRTLEIVTLYTKNKEHKEQDETLPPRAEQKN